MAEILSIVFCLFLNVEEILELKSICLQVLFVVYLKHFLVTLLPASLHSSKIVIKTCSDLRLSSGKKILIPVRVFIPRFTEVVLSLSEVQL